MGICSLDDFFAEYTVYETLGKEYYQQAVETQNPDLLTKVIPNYQEPPLNLTRWDNNPIRIHRHERYVAVGYHDHQFLEIMYQYRGQCSQNIEGETMIVNEGELCFVSPGVFHSPAIYDGSILLNIIVTQEALIKICTILEGIDSLISEYLKNIRYNTRRPKYIRCCPGNDPKLYTMLNNLVREYYENKQYCGLMMQSQFMSILYYIMREHEQDCMVSGQQISRITPVLPILQYIQNHYRDVTLEELAKKFSYSEQHICRLIKSRTGRTFNQHLIDLRLTHAKLLLITTNLSFSEIAWYCGYAGDAYFHRLFTKSEGVTPIQYRKQMLKNKN